MRLKSLFRTQWIILLLVVVTYGLQHNSSSSKHKKKQRIHTYTSAGRKIDAVVKKNSIVINVSDGRRVRHRHGKDQAVLEKGMIGGIRCRRYNGGYYIPSRCGNYCNCPYYYDGYKCGPCPYAPYPTYVTPYASIVISKLFFI